MKASSFLITGNDLVGKTTLINLLVPHLNELGYNTLSNKNDLYKTDLMKDILSLLKKNSSSDLFQINSLFFVTFLIDSYKFKQEPNVILIQDSYVCRTMAFCYANQLDIAAELFEKYKDSFFNFDITIHLKATIESRIQRLNARATNNSQDHLILTDQRKVIEMDHHLDRIVSTKKEYIEIDTSDLSIPQVFDEVIKYVNKFI